VPAPRRRRARPREHLVEGRAALAAPGEDGYAPMVRDALDRIATEIGF
jgi:hypothetical protein